MSKRPPIDQSLWQPWIDHVCAAVGVDPGDVDVRTIHELTSHVVEVFERPMAPVSAHLWGMARGAGSDPDTAKREIWDAAVAAGESSGRKP